VTIVSGMTRPAAAMLRLLPPPPPATSSPPADVVPRGGADALGALEDDVAALRESMFEVLDTAREVLPHGLTDLHVALQRASNELGEAQRRLHDAAIRVG